MKTRTLKEAQALSFESFSTWSVLVHLYKRHETFILYLCVVCTWTWVFVTRLG